MSIFLTSVSLFKWIRSFSTSARSILSSSTVFVSSIPNCLCFSHPPSLCFSPRTQILIKVSILLVEISPFFSRQYSYPVIHKKMLLKLQVRLSSLIFFSGGFKSSFVDHIFSLFQCFLMPVHFLIIPFSLFNCSGVLKISQKDRLVIQDPPILF